MAGIMYTTFLALHLLRLGTLACHTYDVPDLTAVASRTLLTELENCSSDNPRIKKVSVTSLYRNS